MTKQHAFSIYHISTFQLEEAYSIYIIILQMGPNKLT